MVRNEVKSRNLGSTLNHASGVGEEQPEKAPRLLNPQALLSDEDCELAVLASKVKLAVANTSKFSHLG